MSANKVVKVSVRDLVQFVFRSGDLTSIFTTSSRMVDGGKIHRKIQKSQGADYQSEVSLAITVDKPSVTLQISGRADGVIVIKDKEKVEQVTIDEIKSTTTQLELIEDANNPLHWAQAKCYAYIYAVQKGLASINVQITYCQVDTLEVKIFKNSYLLTELANFFNSLVTQYTVQAEQLGDWLETQDMSARQLEFPFASFRKGQRELAVAVYKTVSMGLKLYAQAPTGTGKTIATLFPAVKAVGMGYSEKIFFLTAKTVTRQLAEEAFEKLRRSGLRFKTVTLSAKDKICFLPQAACTPEECSYAKGYYDRVGKALNASWHLESFTRGEIEHLAREFMICPFEFSLELALWADAVICDYNYVFDPSVYLKHFFNESNVKYSLLVDEAHNLVDRAREMFSAELSKKEFLDLKKIIKDKLPQLAKAAGKINSLLAKTGKLCLEELAFGKVNYFVREEYPSDILPALRKFNSLAEEWLAGNEATDYREELLDIYFKVYAFLRTIEMYDERYVTYAERREKDVVIKLFCVNPSHLLRQALTRGSAAVLFSATLTPLDYFIAILGGEAEDGRLAAASPFEQDNLCLIVADNISTKYKDRENTYDNIVENIAAAVEAKVGNYLVFLPSYRYLDEVYQRFCLRNSSVRVIRQVGEMPEEDRLEFLRQFSEDNNRTLVGFAVLGGIFGEGIDLAGDRLVGSIIVGVGLPQVCLEREIIKDWFDKDNCKGFEYAYVYPGMNKVLQAAGRVIRTETDKGIVLLIDDRFSQFRYKRLFPPEWRRAENAKTSRCLSDKARRFWLNAECHR